MRETPEVPIIVCIFTWKVVIGVCPLGTIKTCALNRMRVMFKFLKIKGHYSIGVKNKTLVIF